LHRLNQKKTAVTTGQAKNFSLELQNCLLEGRKTHLRVFPPTRGRVGFILVPLPFLRLFEYPVAKK